VEAFMVDGVVMGGGLASAERVLTPDAVAFLAELGRRFRGRRDGLLAARRARLGTVPSFRPETAHLREGDWRCAPLPSPLLDRRVEITGPVDRKMVINALNSGARVFMADFEDSNAPSARNVVEGQQNLMDAVRGTLRFDDPRTGKHYRLNDETAILMVRPRGWHLDEAHFVVDGAPIPGALFDFGLYYFHNARDLVLNGRGPWFYLPKIEAWEEAALWDEVFVFAQESLGLPIGTIKATVLIETLPASFQIDEILYAAEGPSAGLNCGRWDYIFSYIKTVTTPPGVATRSLQVGMTQPFLAGLQPLLIQTCHKRGVHAMGGMAAQIPDQGSTTPPTMPPSTRCAPTSCARSRTATTAPGSPTPVSCPSPWRVRRHMPGPNQIARLRDDVTVTAADLLASPRATRTEAGVRHNIRVAMQYLEAWLRGEGCVPLYDLMEDAATAEIARTPGLAVDAPRGHARRRPARHRRAGARLGGPGPHRPDRPRAIRA
jgi:malate synthase